MSLAENVYKFRALNFLSQKDLAIKSGVSTTYISQIETGHTNKTVSSVVRIAQVLQIPPCLLFADEMCPKYLQCLNDKIF